MSIWTKNLSRVLLMGLVFSPFFISAHHHDDCSSSEHHHEKRIKESDVVGTYQISGFSNSLDGPGTPTQPQSQSVIGQLQFFKHGVGRIVFVDFTVVVGGQIFNNHFENIPFTYSLGPINGQGVAVVPDFPVVGTNPTFSMSFKMRNGKVVGFSQLVTASTTPTSRWTLIQGERFE